MTARAQATFEAFLLREFLAEPELEREYDVAATAEAVGEALGVAHAEALERAHDAARWDALVKAVASRGLGELVRFEHTGLLFRSRADIVAALRSSHDAYATFCRHALCHALQGEHERAFGALRGAAARHEEWARHHHVYGLIHAVCGDVERARYELEFALQAEPVPAARTRIVELLAAIDAPGA